jgi:hypothetical protein
MYVLIRDCVIARQRIGLQRRMQFSLVSGWNAIVPVKSGSREK